MTDPWTEAMHAGAFDKAWRICDAVMLERRGISCAGQPYHLRWVWDGTPIADRRALIRCYHGLGDTLQFIRFVPRVASLARAVAVEAQPELLPLIASVSPVAEFIPLGAEPPAWDVAIESMELPHALRLKLAELPGPVPYLALPTQTPRDAARPGSRPLRVGLVWAGGNWRSERSVPPSLLRPVVQLPIELVILQLGPGRADPDAAPILNAAYQTLPERSTILETASVIEALDLIITIDSMVAHLAGALGRPVWTLLDADADWRWMRHRSDSPWYPTMRLFRQRQQGRWAPVITEILSLLQVAARSRLREQWSTASVE